MSNIHSQNYQSKGSKQAGKQEGKYLEGIKSEPCPVGACLIIHLFNILFKCHSVTTITIKDCRCAKKLKGTTWSVYKSQSSRRKLCLTQNVWRLLGKVVLDFFLMPFYFIFGNCRSCFRLVRRKKRGTSVYMDWYFATSLAVKGSDHIDRSSPCMKIIVRFQRISEDVKYHLPWDMPWQTMARVWKAPNTTERVVPP